MRNYPTAYRPGKVEQSCEGRGRSGRSCRLLLFLLFLLFLLNSSLRSTGVIQQHNNSSTITAAQQQ
jgi:hypothetical protein